MSTIPITAARNDQYESPITVQSVAQMHSLGEPLAMVTAYDYPSARIAQAAGVEMILVGDSAAMVVLGHDSTVPVTMDEMVMLAAAVRRGASRPLIVGDMPFGSYEASDHLAVENAQRFVKEAGCDAVKLEGGGTSALRAKAIFEAGIPVMGHVGLTPQTAAALGGFKAQGKTAGAARKVLDDARRLEAAGCFAVVIECVPAAVTELISSSISIPSIGIGAGPSTSGQVLVFHDLVGLREGKDAKFVRRYADLMSDATAAVRSWTEDVKCGAYPGPEHIYSIEPGELAALQDQSEPAASVD